ncbi:MAG TPA: hypothetical protein PLE71_16575 [Flavobacteriales bacterium]|nr:hypothetical protein [Flavobacteriales bacterium]
MIMHTSLGGSPSHCEGYGDLPSRQNKLDMTLRDLHIFGRTEVFGEIQARHNAIDALWKISYPIASDATLIGTRSKSKKI